LKAGFLALQNFRKGIYEWNQSALPNSTARFTCPLSTWIYAINFARSLASDLIDQESGNGRIGLKSNKTEAKNGPRLKFETAEFNFFYLLSEVFFGAPKNTG